MLKGVPGDIGGLWVGEGAGLRTVRDGNIIQRAGPRMCAGSIDGSGPVLLHRVS